MICAGLWPSSLAYNQCVWPVCAAGTGQTMGRTRWKHNDPAAGCGDTKMTVKLTQGNS